ncbi:hypothetical protein ACIB24_07950 [Spongisporangium articulatum]|uniref:Uncharacterized protein n=1 Tax=Spongisporangium articulatum TaxID=3362603 RepID=A0ABW8AKX6_9ACTN
MARAPESQSARPGKYREPHSGDAALPVNPRTPEDDRTPDGTDDPQDGGTHGRPTWRPETGTESRTKRRGTRHAGTRRPGHDGRPDSRLPAWLLPAIAGAAVVAVVVLIAAVVVPSVGDHRRTSRWESTSVSLPTSLAGRAKLSGARATNIVKTLSVSGLPAQNVGVYGTYEKGLVVVSASKPSRPLTDADADRQKALVQKAFSTQSALGTSLVLKEQDVGSLGGYVGCGTISAGKVTVCLATDAGSIVTMLAGPGVTDPIALMGQARAATVHRS